MIAIYVQNACTWVKLIAFIKNTWSDPIAVNKEWKKIVFWGEIPIEFLDWFILFLYIRDALIQCNLESEASLVKQILATSL
jgi:hypothetical protein